MIAARLRPSSFVFILALCCCLFALLAGGAARAQTGSFPSGAVNLGSVAVKTGTPTTATLTFTFATGGTIAAPAVVTQGAPNLDFTDAGTGTCTTNGTSHVYNAKDLCTVVVKFAPRYPGTIYGAVVLSDASGTPIATGYIHGNGTAPQISFSPATQSTVPVSNGQPEVALAVDESGDLYLNNGSGLVKEAPSESGYVESPVAEVDGTCGTAVDGAGNVYASAGFDGEVMKESLSSTGYTQSTVATSTSYNPYGWVPAGLAVDVAGNVYVDDDDSGVVVKETPSGSSYTESLVANGPNPGWALAVDGSGDIFITDVFDPTIWKETPSDGGYTQSTFGSGLSLNQEGAHGPRGLAVDGIGDVYVADLAGGSVVEERPESSGYLQSTLAGGFNTPWGIGVDGAGNIYFTNAGGEPVKLDVVDPPFTVAASSSYGPPFGAIGQAIDAATRSTTVATGDNLLVTGWAADPHDGAPVSSVSILIDGAPAGTATLGIARPDVAAAQKTAAYLNSGWTFTMAASGLSAGTHTVSATASDSLGLSGTLGKQTITVAATSPDGPPFGSLGRAVDATTGQTTVSQEDNLLVEGWAADVHDGAPVSQVSILIDGTAEGYATLGIAQPGMAKKLGSRYMNSGWTFTLAASSLAAGAHTVTAVASDSLGLSTQFQIREITVTP